MWGLYSATNHNIVYYLPSGRVYTIGRKDTDVVVTGDPSVSRKHATISVEDDKVVFSECKTKFGSAVNGKKVTDSETELAHNDVLKIGQGPTSLRLLKRKLTFCCSNMPLSLKKKVKNQAELLGGTAVTNWSASCTHLVMTAVTVTVKVVNALSSCCPIVTPSWIETSAAYFKDKKVLPMAESYRPSFVDTNVHFNGVDICLAPSEDRRHLFKNKKIYFLDKDQFTTLKYCLNAAEGQTLFLSMDTPPSVYCDDDAIVIEPQKNKVPAKDKERFQECLMENDLRFVTEAEIGYAFLLKSTEKYCNPKATIDNLPSYQLPSASLSQAAAAPLSYQSQSSTIYNTQQTDTTILAQNTELSQMDAPLRKRGLGKRTNDGGIDKIDETVIKEEPLVNDPIVISDDDFEQPSSSKRSKTVKQIKTEPVTNTSSQVPVVTSSASLQSNATILAMDSLPQPSLNSSVHVPDQGIIASAFKDSRKRNKRQQSDSETESRSKKTKSDTQTSPATVGEKDEQLSLLDGIASDVPDDPAPYSPNPLEATPLNRPVNDGFMSARKRTPVKKTPVKSQAESRRGRTGTRLELSQTDTQNETENPLPSIAHDNNSNDVVTDNGFINARKRPVVKLPVVKTEQADYEADFSSFPAPIVECVKLVAKRQRPPQSSVTHDIPGVVNFKKFKKVQHIGSSFDRLIGGSDLSVYAV